MSCTFYPNVLNIYVPEDDEKIEVKLIIVSAFKGVIIYQKTKQNKTKQIIGEEGIENEKQRMREN